MYARTLALGRTAVAYFVASASFTVASIARYGLACGPTTMTGLEACACINRALKPHVSFHHGVIMVVFLVKQLSGTFKMQVERLTKDCTIHPGQNVAPHAERLLRTVVDVPPD